MPSIVSGYEYDIFISYRQKDNKGDRWVSEFVDALKTELESTFKEEISVYFDINPHDGLLETHDVNASLNEKLKCLVLIPIISRTYCDPRSFAWEHEFKAFVEQASQDQFGLKVKLPNGNVANRVLPVLIHNLDSDDMKLCESILGGVLRGIEFIYKEPGVNKPLNVEDDERKNLNTTKYRIQINKVANAVKEIISGLITESIEPSKEMIQHSEPSEEAKKEENEEVRENIAKASKRKLLSAVEILVILIIAAFFAYTKIFKKDTLEKLRSSGERISVTVMPFQNMTNDTIWNVWQDGIQDILINYLSNSPEELQVRNTKSVKDLIQSRGPINYASITPSIASNISQKLNANLLIYGSIKQAGSRLRLNAQLLDSKTEQTIKSFEIDGRSQEEAIFQITDSLKHIIRNYIIISKLRKEVTPDVDRLVSTNSPEAYRYFIYGQKAYYKIDYDAAYKWLSMAITIDSNFFYAGSLLSNMWKNSFMYDSAKKVCLRLYKKRDQMSLQLKLNINILYANLFESPNEEIIYLNQLLDSDDQNPIVYNALGNSYSSLNQFENAVPVYEKGIEITEKWGLKSPVYYYTNLGRAYHYTGQYEKENKLYKKVEKDFPDNYLILMFQAILSFAEGDTVAANTYIKKYLSTYKENAPSEADIKFSWGFYEGNPDKEEAYLRHALKIQPENPMRLNNLAWFLIDKERNVNEGMELIDKALKLNLDKYHYADCKGWGYYKQGNYREALKYLEKADSLKPIYDHNSYLHLEAAKKAGAGQK